MVITSYFLCFTRRSDTFLRRFYATKLRYAAGSIRTTSRRSRRNQRVCVLIVCRICIKIGLFLRQKICRKMCGCQLQAYTLSCEQLVQRSRHGMMNDHVTHTMTNKPIHQYRRHPNIGKIWYCLKYIAKPTMVRCTWKHVQALARHWSSLNSAAWD